jgi:hypothetical protein
VPAQEANTDVAEIASKREEPEGVSLVPSGVQLNSTRDLQKCVKADLQNNIDPEVLKLVRQQAKRTPCE